VAEGIETTDQAETLLALGCRGAQGYLFGRPSSAATIEALLGEVDTQARPPQPSAVGTD
jgi:EAL domain-containing protein (putative c-di-GMP-specific phosphodiesterase class I)